MTGGTGIDRSGAGGKGNGAFLREKRAACDRRGGKPADRKEPDLEGNHTGETAGRGETGKGAACFRRRGSCAAVTVREEKRKEEPERPTGYSNRGNRYGKQKALHEKT